MLWLVDRSIAMMGFGRTRAVLLRTSPGPKAEIKDRQRAEAIARTVSRVAGRRRFNASCLRQCLVTEWLLGWKRIPTDFRLGARTDDGVWTGHSWLEHDGPLLPADADAPSRYQMRWDGHANPPSLP